MQIRFINRDHRFSIINNKDVRIHLLIDEVFFLILIFNWRIIALECCVGFYHTTVQISHKCVCINIYIYIYIYIPSLSRLPPNHPHHSTLLSHHRTVKLGSLGYIANSHQPSILHMLLYKYMSMLSSQFIPPSLPLTVSKNPFSMPASVFLPCKQARQYHFF